MKNDEIKKVQPLLQPHNVVRSPLWQEVAHLYLGCEVLATYNNVSDSRGYLTGITNGGTECEIQLILEDGFNVEEEPYFNLITEVKPVLRSITSMNQIEMEELLIKKYAPNEDIFMQRISSIIFLTHEIKRNIKRGEGVCYSTFRSDGSHYSTGTLSFKNLNPTQFRYLLSLHFDLFELIETGTALNLSELNVVSER
ncbi:MAG TPA: hypothetical protein VF622_18960 [Segetibacter sp.]|jgi:hypothetical protein